MRKLISMIFALVSVGFFLGNPVAAEPKIEVFIGSSVGAVTLTDEQLRALPQVVIKTNSPWTESVMEYEGPTLWSVLKEIGATDRDLEMIALNDYIIRLTADRITPDWPIIARLQNGKTMSVRQKGPYWLMFPFDDNQELQTEIFYALSIWQLSQIKVLN